MTRTLELLDRLVAFPTVSHASNLDLIHWARGLLHSAGFATAQIPSPCGTKAGLHARIGPDVPGGVCLSGHTDVVPSAGQHWTRPDFALTREAGHLFGRGTTDMKGFVASALALSLRAGDAQLKAPLSLVLSYDEEIGCVGIQQMLPQLAPLMGQPRLVIVGEPTSMQLAVGHKGKAALHVTCHGEAGHSALAPRFVNAIHLAADFVQALRALQDSLAGQGGDPDYEIPYSTLHVGKISGGQALNIVPDKAVLEMEIRHLPDTAATELLGQVAQISQGLAVPERVEIVQGSSYPGLAPDQSRPALAFAAQLAEVETTSKVAFGTEAGVFAQMGLDTVICGPGDMQRDGHKPDESLSVAQLAACDAMMDRVLAALT